MAAVVNTYKVHCHREVNGKKAGPEYIEYVQAAAGDYNSLTAVLSSNARCPGQGTVQISSAMQVSPTAAIG
jgi:hypothetical protein